MRPVQDLLNHRARALNRRKPMTPSFHLPLRSTLPLVLLALLLGHATHAAEETKEITAAPPKESKFLPWEKGSLKFGGFAAAFDSTIGFGINHAAGLTLNAEELLDLDTSLVVFRADAMYRPGKSLRHQLELSYARYHRDGSATLNEEIEINDITFPVGARVESVFNFDIIRGDYTYAILQDERMRIAVGLGLYAVPLRYSLEGETTGAGKKWRAPTRRCHCRPWPSVVSSNWCRACF